ncbi:nuclear pore complex protein Nup98-Nup96-like [Toxorhynchites rutilus septentrionalis]|uniref:nuclear pore complex protein Nup98-Nup96-like n=1 Tax=Toxorhynchites rutilus septentrionalis TaxID=329112 RepID=UPI0024784C34|nr:nuclear pore complex protein Nup98-Nup96-like [Toxorhynchites rutilus septentrionalis]
MNLSDQSEAMATGARGHHWSILPCIVLLTTTSLIRWDVKQISNWFIKGKILSDFIELNVKFDLTRNTIDDEVSATRLEVLKPKLSDLCSAIKMFPCPTQKYRFR